MPTGIATDSSTSHFFGCLVSSNRIVALYSFYEIRAWFKGTDDRKSFCILCVGTARNRPEFAFDLDAVADLENAERRFSLSPEQIGRINPNTKTAPVFRSRADAALTAKIYDRVPILKDYAVDPPRDPWTFRYMTKMFDMADHSDTFVSRGDFENLEWQWTGSDWLGQQCNATKRCVPLYEAKMIHHFDHRWATYAGANGGDEEGARDVTLDEKRDPAFEPEPRYWVPEDEVTLRAARAPSRLKSAWRRRDKGADACARLLAEWLAGAFPQIEGRPLAEHDLCDIFGYNLDWNRIVEKPFPAWLAAPKGEAMQAETPLTSDDLAFLREGPSDLLDLSWAIIEASDIVCSIVEGRQPPTLTADRLIKSRHRMLWSDQRAWMSAI